MIKHVSVTGSDTNSGDAESSAYRTIGHALTRISGGDMIQIHEGDYAEHISNGIPGGSSWQNCTTIQAAPSERVWLKPNNYDKYWSIYLNASGQQYIQFLGVNLDSRQTRGGMRIESTPSGNPHHIRYQGAEIVGGPDGVSETLYGPQHFAVTQSHDGLLGGHEFIDLSIHGGGDPGEMYYGFYINADDVTLNRCKIYDISGYCVQIYSGYNTSERSTVRNATIKNCRFLDVSRSMDDRSGVTFATGQGHKYYNNVVSNIPMANGFGVNVYPGVSVAIANNTFFKTGIGIRTQGGSNTTVQNNIAYKCSQNFINESGVASDHNLIGIDPLFVDEAMYDLHLASTSSPAHSMGIAITGLTTDIDGTVRHNPPDIGAYEFAGTTPNPPNPNGKCDGDVILMVAKIACLAKIIKELRESGLLPPRR